MCIRAISWALATKVGDKNAKLVLISLADNADAEQYQCWPSAEHIAERCEISRRSVFYAMIYLKEKGLISCEHRRWPGGVRRSPLYTVMVPKPTDTQTEPSAPYALPSAPRAPLSATGDTRSAPVCTRGTVTEPSQRKSGDENLKKEEFKVWISRDSEDWKPWAQHWRKTRGVAPPTTTSHNELGWWFSSLTPPH